VSEAPPDATAVDHCWSLSAVSDEQQIISGPPWHDPPRKAFNHHQEAASQVYSIGREESEMKPKWRLNRFWFWIQVPLYFVLSEYGRANQFARANSGDPK
jgi:hypothetical protein